VGALNDLLVVVDLLGVAQVRIVEGGSIAVLASRGGLLSGSVNRLAHDVGGGEVAGQHEVVVEVAGEAHGGTSHMGVLLGHGNGELGDILAGQLLREAGKDLRRGVRPLGEPVLDLLLD